MPNDPQQRRPAPEPRGGVSTPWARGRVVADHRLLELLGRGAFGHVWRAEHLPTGGLRAIKTLPSEACFEDRARFAREVGALAQLDGHPHVVR
ncbi:MAG: protein kinase, partial [Planctomycetes bacterium]|nr:protein kinase [Planctomycetota bacterium]